MATTAMKSRMKKELQMLEEDPPYGICAWPKADCINILEAQIRGPQGSPYEKGIFNLEIIIPDRYPFEPPKVRFMTPIYHPNIDSGGRICLDTLNMPPKGAWTPSLNVPTVLTSIHLLMSEPNPDDGLMADITAQYKSNKSQFLQMARQWTEKFAMGTATTAANASTPPPDVTLSHPQPAADVKSAPVEPHVASVSVSSSSSSSSSSSVPSGLGKHGRADDVAQPSALVNASSSPRSSSPVSASPASSSSSSSSSTISATLDSSAAEKYAPAAPVAKSGAASSSEPPSKKSKLKMSLSSKR